MGFKVYTQAKCLLEASVVNGFPVCGISFHFGIKNEIRKEYLGTGY